MPFQAGSQNYELSFQGKTLRLAGVLVTGIWPEVAWQDGTCMLIPESGFS